MRILVITIWTISLSSYCAYLTIRSIKELQINKYFITLKIAIGTLGSLIILASGIILIVNTVNN